MRDRPTKPIIPSSEATVSDDDLLPLFPSDETEPVQQSSDNSTLVVAGVIVWAVWLTFWLFMLLLIHVNVLAALLGGVFLATASTGVLAFWLYRRKSASQRVTLSSPDQTLLLPAVEHTSTHTAQHSSSPVRAHPRTRKLAAKNAQLRRKLINKGTLSSGDNTKDLLPEDLEYVTYDQRPHIIFVFRIFTEVFSRKQFKFRRAVVCYLIWMGIFVASALGITRPNTMEDATQIAVVSAICYVIIIAFGVMYALNGVRLVKTKTKLTMFRRAWPFLPPVVAGIFNANLTESKLAQSFWGTIFRYGELTIESTEQNPMIKGWSFARHPEELHALLQIEAGKKPLT